MKNKKTAFTLVELIVTITILSILGTIGFISFQGYSKDSRNTVRINDVKVIQKAIELYFLKNEKYPLPDNPTEVTYSGGLLWTQGYFGSNVRADLGNISNVPKDPLLNLDYTYSVFNRGNKYQLGLVYEGSNIANNYPLNKTYALSNADSKAYVVGNYDLLDIKSSTGAECKLISAPSIIINNLPGDGILTKLGTYDFVYNKSLIVPSNYEALMDIDYPGFGFKIDEVYNKCSVDYLSDINTYITGLSDIYQQFSGIQAYDEVSNHSRTLKFIDKSIKYLEQNNITIAEGLVKVLKNVFIDTFSGNNNDEIVGEHTTDTLGSWDFVNSSTNSGSYIITNNKLQKTDNSSDMINPVLLSSKTSADSTVSLKITNFNGGNLVLYGRYIDSDNNYSVTLSSLGYILNKTVGGAVTSLSIVSSSISNDSNIQFVLTGNNIKLIINGNELENIVDTSITSIGKDALHMTNSGMIVDDYMLYY